MCIRSTSVALVFVSVVAAQSTDKVVRIAIPHLLRAEKAAQLPRLTPVDGSTPMLALGRANPGQPDTRLLDFVAASLNSHSGKRSKVQIKDAAIEASCEGLKAARIRDIMLDGIDCLVPEITLAVSVYGELPAPSSVVLAPGDDSSLPKKTVYSRSLVCASAQTATCQFGDTGSSHLRLRLQPHLLIRDKVAIALFCEFESELQDRTGGRRWSAGTASATVPAGGKMVLTLPGRAIAVQATHKPRPVGTRQRIGVSWSLLTTSALRMTPCLGKPGPALLQYKRLPPANNPDTLLANLREKMPLDGVMAAGMPSRLLLVSPKPKLLSEARRAIREDFGKIMAAWSEMASVDYAITSRAKHGAAIARLPTMPGRACVLLHTDTGASDTRGALVAFNWYPNVKERHLTGFAVSLHGAATPSGKETPIDVKAVAKQGATHLVRSKDIQLKISRR